MTSPPYSAGFVPADEYYAVPLAYSPSFVKDLQSIIQGRGDNLTVPTVDDEIEALARATRENEGIAGLVSKGRMILHPWTPSRYT